MMKLNRQNSPERPRRPLQAIKKTLITDFAKEKITNYLADADITINGGNAWDIQIHDERLYNRVLLKWTLGLGEAYMDGWWDADALDQFIYKLLMAKIEDKNKDLPSRIDTCKARITNRQTKFRSRKVAQVHYDIGNDFYQHMLDTRMIYSCGFWKTAANLDEAQEAKLDIVCRKLELKPGMRVLDIGCGWGGMAKFATENYGVKVVGVTISEEQAGLAQERCAGLPIDIRLQDYRNINDSFDRILSLGMFEHVGYKNYHTFMAKVRSLLKGNGLFLLHTIANNLTTTHCDPWFNKYIFPNGMLPSIKQLGETMEGLFIMEDWHNFGPDYDKTLLAWFQNFDSHWQLYKRKYTPRFYRMWKYYLLSLAGAFRARRMQLWQIVMSKNGLIGGYESIR
ncbi:MAG: cyclopropane fatty acyl phospholipid synthase [Desulfobulbales bacterium]